MRRFLLISGIFLLLFGCASSPKYRWRFAMQEPKPSESMAFSDDYIDALFIIREIPGTIMLKPRLELGFEVQNKTDSGIKINWDELSMIYPDGKSFRVIHSGTRLVDKNSPQAPTTIPPNAKISDILTPSENISYVSEGGILPSGWYYSTLFGGDNKLVWDGKEFSIYFPMEIKGA